MEGPQQQCRGIFGDRAMRAFLLFLGLLPALSLAQTVTCPESVPETSIEVKRPPAGWLATAPGLVRLDGGGMLSGNPTQMQYLVPGGSKKIKGGETSTWSFEPGEEKWLYCTYGKMAIQLSKRMDDKAKNCEVTAKLERKDVIASITAVCR
jgi:hypothetical protein